MFGRRDLIPPAPGPEPDSVPYRIYGFLLILSDGVEVFVARALSRLKFEESESIRSYKNIYSRSLSYFSARSSFWRTTASEFANEIAASRISLDYKSRKLTLGLVPKRRADL